MNKPQIRFKGFEDEWQEALVSEKCNFLRGQGYSKSDLKESGHPIFLYGRLYTKYSTFVKDVDTYADLQSFAVLSTGKEIVMPSSGEEAEGISVASAVLSKGIILGGGLNILIPNQKEIHNPFLALNLTFGSPHKDLAKRAQGKSVVHLYNQDIASVSINYPQIEEQASIAEYFMQIDEMIAEAEREVSRLEKMKQASLQKMFPRPGATAPEIRFDGFTEPWQSYRLCDICNYRSSSLKVSDAKKSGRYVLYDANNPIGFIDSEPIRSEYVSIIKDGAGVGRCRLLPHNTLIIGTLGAIIPKENCHIDFLYNIIGNLRLGEKISGSTIPHIYFSEYGLSPVLAPSFSEQRVIGEYFRNLDSLLSAKRQKLVKLRNIKQACLDKMFVNTSDL